MRGELAEHVTSAKERRVLESPHGKEFKFSQ